MATPYASRSACRYPDRIFAGVTRCPPSSVPSRKRLRPRLWGQRRRLRHLIDGIAQINCSTGTKYKVSWQVINTAGYGVPQIRERVFLIGSRDGHCFKFPTTTHAKPEDLQAGLFEALEPCHTAWDAIGDLESHRLASQTSRSVANGEICSPAYRKGRITSGILTKGREAAVWVEDALLELLALRSLPSVREGTIRPSQGAAIGPFHWDNRRLTFRELCRLQTFPDGLKLECGRTEMQRMLGNAVPSLIAEILGREIRRQLLGAPIDGPLRLLPSRRKRIPSPEKVQPVPQKYLGYVESIKQISRHWRGTAWR